MSKPTKLEYFANGGKSLYTHKGVTFHSSFIPPDCWDDIETFQARPSDICVASSGRSGTHWMLRIVDLILGNDDSGFLNSPNFEVLSINAVMNPDTPGRMGYQVVTDLSTGRPRVLHSHLPASHVPKSFWNTDGVKIIYIIRNPFDVLKSLYKFNSQFVSDFPPFSSFVRRVALDPNVAQFGTWVDHVRGFWERRNHKNLLFVHYEDLQENFRSTVASMANFLGRHLSEEQLEWVQERSAIDVMRAIQTESLKNKGTGAQAIVDRGLSNEAIVDYSDEDVAFMKSQLKKLADTDIRYVKEIL